jgi:hypothetical protein
MSIKSIIKTHDVTLYGGSGHSVILRPLNDKHLVLQYKWCADPEILYWTEGGTAETNLSYGQDTVHQIYGGVSQMRFASLSKRTAFLSGNAGCRR